MIGKNNLAHNTSAWPEPRRESGGKVLAGIQMRGRCSMLRQLRVFLVWMRTMHDFGQTITATKTNNTLLTRREMYPGMHLLIRISLVTCVRFLSLRARVITKIWINVPLVFWIILLVVHRRYIMIYVLKWGAEKKKKKRNKFYKYNNVSLFAGAPMLRFRRYTHENQVGLKMNEGGGRNSNSPSTKSRKENRSRTRTSARLVDFKKRGFPHIFQGRFIRFVEFRWTA